MDSLSIALWAQVVAEASVGLAHCAILAVFLWQQHQYLQERARILDEKEAQWRALFARWDNMREPSHLLRRRESQPANGAFGKSQQMTFASGVGPKGLGSTVRGQS